MIRTILSSIFYQYYTTNMYHYDIEYDRLLNDECECVCRYAWINYYLNIHITTDTDDVHTYFRICKSILRKI